MLLFDDGQSQRKRTPPPFRGTSALSPESDPATAQLLFRIIISVNQLSIYEAISNWCEELALQISDPSSYNTRKPVAELHYESESRVAPTLISILTNAPLVDVPGKPGAQTRKIRKTFQKTFK